MSCRCRHDIVGIFVVSARHSSVFVVQHRHCRSISNLSVFWAGWGLPEETDISTNSQENRLFTILTPNAFSMTFITLGYCHRAELKSLSRHLPCRERQPSPYLHAAVKSLAGGGQSKPAYTYHPSACTNDKARE